MDTPAPGTPPQEQPPGTPPVEQAPAAPGQPPQAAAPAPPTAEDFQRQLQQERQQREQLESNYKSLQGEFTRRSQALAQLTGNTGPAAPPVDPLQQYVDIYTRQGFDPKQARAAAEVQFKMAQDLAAPLQQQVQIARQSSNVDYAIQQAMGMRPGLFRNQQDVDTARQAAIAHIQAGGEPNPRLMCSIVNDSHFWEEPASPSAPPAAMQPLQPQPFANGFNRIGGGFQPAPQINPQTLSPESQRVADEIAARLKK